MCSFSKYLWVSGSVHVTFPSLIGGLPTNLNGGGFPQRWAFLRPCYFLIIVPMVGNPYLFNKFLVCIQRYLYGLVFHIIIPPRFCVLFILLNNITLRHHLFWPMSNHKLIFHQFSSSSVYHVSYVGL